GIVTIVETPRDAFQGLPKLIPTAEKVRYIGALLDAGFTHIDLASFVSPKAVPQMADSNDVVAAFAARTGLERIAIIANEEGMKRAIDAGNLEAVGFPFSLSEQFQLRNTRKSRQQTWPVVESILRQAGSNKLEFILYLSMAFGNPDGEIWTDDLLFTFIEQ